MGNNIDDRESVMAEDRVYDVKIECFGYLFMWITDVYVSYYLHIWGTPRWVL